MQQLRALQPAPSCRWGEQQLGPELLGPEILGREILGPELLGGPGGCRGSSVRPGATACSPGGRRRNRGSRQCGLTGWSTHTHGSSLFLYVTHNSLTKYG